MPQVVVGWKTSADKAEINSEKITNNLEDQSYTRMFTFTSATVLHKFAYNLWTFCAIQNQIKHIKTTL